MSGSKCYLPTQFLHGIICFIKRFNYQGTRRVPESHYAATWYLYSDAAPKSDVCSEKLLLFRSTCAGGGSFGRQGDFRHLEHCDYPPFSLCSFVVSTFVVPQWQKSLSRISQPVFCTLKHPQKLILANNRRRCVGVTRLRYTFDVGI